jgi:tetratricopeptide (TPR) repeat protein
MISITALVMISSLRTKPLSPNMRKGLYTKNRFLWGNYYEYGYYLMMKKRPEKAMEAYMKAREILPDRPQPSRYIASIWESRKQWDLAEKYYKEALEINPEYKRARFLLEQMKMKRAYYEK